MDSFFGKKKSRPRNSSVSTNQELTGSVPYHKLGPPQKSPVTVGTMSQGLRGNPAAVISAPMTNPPLFSDMPRVSLAALGLVLPVGIAAVSWLVPPRRAELTRRTAIA